MEEVQATPPSCAGGPPGGMRAISRQERRGQAGAVVAVAVTRASAWRSFRRVVLALAAAGLMALVSMEGLRLWDERTRTELPPVAGVDTYHLFVDDTPVPMTVTAGWTAVPYTATRDAVRTDQTLWRRMHVADWDGLPDGLRRDGLEAMLVRYRPLLTMPSAWDRMTAHDWDMVPQPIRALAFRHMVQYWSGYYHVGRHYGLAPRLVADTAAAIVMSESWFEHRAINVNRWGNRDLGLAQASDSARMRLADLHDHGISDVVLSDEDYFDPWQATRFVAIWLSFLLDELDGDLNAAVRAYHRGLRNALRGEGDEYLAGVLRRRREYMRNESPSPAWRYLWTRDRTITQATWPWLHARRVLSGTGRRETVAFDRPGDPEPTWWRLALTGPPAIAATAVRR